MKKKILGTGLSGLVGSRITELLSSDYEFEDVSYSTGVDITNKNQLLEKFKNSDASTVLHLAAKADVDGCEKDKELGENGDAWKINVGGTENVVSSCATTGKKLIYISTDFIFDGEHTPENGYKEEDIPNPLNWYAKTKYEGELRVMQSRIPYIIVRIAYPFRAKFERNDFVRAMKSRLDSNLPIAGITDHIFTPTFIDDIANGLNLLITQWVKGIYHMTGAQSLSPYECAMLIAKEFDLNEGLISKTTREAYFKGKAPRPFNVAMNNDKIEKLGIKMRGFEEGIAAIKQQLEKSE